MNVEEENKSLEYNKQLVLKQLWFYLLRFWGEPLEESILLELLDTINDNKVVTEPKKSSSYFGWGSKSTSGDTKGKTDMSFDPFTKYGIDKDASESLFWNSLNIETPDDYVLKFLRARKWHFEKSISMLVKALEWRLSKFDTLKIIRGGERKFYNDNKQGVVKNLELQKAVICGYDLKGRPIIIVRPHLHYSKDQTPEELEEYALLVIEQTRLFFKEPVLSATILFDLTDFTMANMDYAPVKFLVEVFEAHYPECLGHLMIHNAPWLFSPIWNVIKAWLDPIVASKIMFTYNTKDLLTWISKENLPEYLGGELGFDFDSYVCPDESADETLTDVEQRDPIQKEREAIIRSLKDKTIEWIKTKDETKSQELFNERIEIMEKLSKNYASLDLYVRSRSTYDINGSLKL
ncbi:hypothetical protein TPHA_0B00860 [Tetrapisispora phaffii CBS 4417]|uniref:CRAL-TRIO domain-containing protein n=1 Tax=Tetrapisispora phaffii (strain ATCC 24235 / CBS 4417 / NBRC 1672 / NRRL Y-8282 / UCD 70-5) TaxID=1071381 RepID=G8BQG1_TETPH|nr:hypothetical protein TPHA_0B00860 [Tetrapisispora phaffii CBS 4417]CCE61758.1 hypothetical protein TPHA_0B00860 [Tetrapisispora phaffii CBS 4417]